MANRMHGLRRFKETTVESRVVVAARDQFGVVGLKLTPRGQVKYMDRMFLIPGGRPFLIEFKRPGDEPDPGQEHRIDELRSLGYDVEVHDEYHAAMAAIKRRMDG